MQDDFPFKVVMPDGHSVELKFAANVKSKYFPNGEPDWGKILPQAEKAYQRDISEYQSRWLGDRSAGSIPHQRYREFATSPDQKNFDFQGLSPLGQRAIRERFSSEQRGSMAGEKAARQSAGRWAGESPVDSLSEKIGAGEMLTGALFPAANRRLTAAVTGQEASQALPLGLDPQGQLNTSRGFVPGLRRGAGKLGTGEGMAATAGAIAAAPAATALVSQYPLLGLLGAGASLAPAASNIVQGNYGEATSDIIPALLGTKVTKPITSFKETPASLKSIGPKVEKFFSERAYLTPAQRIVKLSSEKASAISELDSLHSDVTKTIQKLNKIIAENNQRASVLETRGNYDAAAQLRKQARDIEVRLARLQLK